MSNNWVQNFYVHMNSITNYSMLLLLLLLVMASGSFLLVWVKATTNFLLVRVKGTVNFLLWRVEATGNSLLVQVKATGNSLLVQVKATANFLPHKSEVKVFFSDTSEGNGHFLLLPPDEVTLNFFSRNCSADCKGLGYEYLVWQQWRLTYMKKLLHRLFHAFIINIL